jgi:hypothetical protein
VPSSMFSTQTQAGTPFPGPLFCDQAPAAAGMLAGAAANTKAKKTALLQWFDELAAEAELEVGYVGNDSLVGRAKAEGKSVLIKLLKVLVENDGKLAGRYVTYITGFKLVLMIILAQLLKLQLRTALLGAAPESFVTGASWLRVPRCGWSRTWWSLDRCGDVSSEDCLLGSFTGAPYPGST